MPFGPASELFRRCLGREIRSELERIGAPSSHLVQFSQRPADGVAAAASHEGRCGRICGILDLDRETAAVFANNLEPRSLPCRRIFDADHGNADRITR